MRVRHACNVPSFIDSLPDGARNMTVKWRCPECRQKWKLVVRPSSQNGKTIGRQRWWRKHTSTPEDRC